MKSAENTVFRFGYGSNMSLNNLKNKKNLNVIWSSPAILRDWELTFFKAIEYVEPAFATIQEELGKEVHGLVFKIPATEANGLDEQEKSYEVVDCKVICYDGTEVTAGIYKGKRLSEEEKYPFPSMRYMNLMIAGAKEIGLKEEYISKLKQIHYTTPREVRAKTKEAVDAYKGDKIWSAKELSEYDGTTEGKPACTSVLGWVVEVNAPFGSWKGHVIDRRNVNHYRGLSVDKTGILYSSPLQSFVFLFSFSCFRFSCFRFRVFVFDWFD